jgi:SNF2 family DNA or RNA helicase
MDAKDTNPSKSALIALDPRALVADECHLIKNPHAARSHAVRRLARNARAFVALSGTPITHHPADLWPTLVCLAPGAFPSRERWVNRYCITVGGDYGETILGLSPATEPEFRLSLLGQQRRVAKADVLDQLPPKVYSVRTVQLPAEYRKAYDALEQDMLAELPDGTELSVMSVLAQLTRLSQLASAAADVKVTFEDLADGTQREHTEVTLKAPSWKVDALLEVLDERRGSPVVVFAPSAQLMRLAAAEAQKAGYRVGFIIGGQSMAERTGTVERFQAGELDLICATTGAGGVGITLTAASTVVFLQRPWSLVESIQAEDRCHRIGSEIHDCIEIVDIVAANTIDTRVRAVLREKAGQLADLVQDPRIVAELLGGASVTRLQQKGHAA